MEDVSGKTFSWRSDVKHIMCVRLKQWPIDRLRRRLSRQRDSAAEVRVVEWLGGGVVGCAPNSHPAGCAPNYPTTQLPHHSQQPLVLPETIASRQIIVD